MESDVKGSTRATKALGRYKHALYKDPCELGTNARK